MQRPALQPPGLQEEHSLLVQALLVLTVQLPLLLLAAHQLHREAQHHIKTSELEAQPGTPDPEHLVLVMVLAVAELLVLAQLHQEQEPQE